MSTLTITGIQSTLHWEDKKANLQMFEEKIFSISKPTEIVSAARNVQHRI